MAPAAVISNSSSNFSGNSGGVSVCRLAPVSGDAAPELTPASTSSARRDRLKPLLLVLLSGTAFSACGGGGGGPAVAAPQAPDKKPGIEPTSDSTPDSDSRAAKSDTSSDTLPDDYEQRDDTPPDDHDHDDLQPDTKPAPEAQDPKSNRKSNPKPAQGSAPQECLAPNVSTSDFIFLIKGFWHRRTHC